MNTGSSLICLIACWLVGGAQAADGEKLPEPRKVTPGVTSGASPSDAIVLFGGENADAWKSVSGNEPVRWRVENGELVVAPGSGEILGDFGIGLEHELATYLDGENHAIEIDTLAAEHAADRHRS